MKSIYPQSLSLATREWNRLQAAILNQVTFVDTVVVRTKDKLDPKFLQNLEQHCGRKPLTRKRFKPFPHYRTIVNLPDDEAIYLIEQNKEARVSEFHIATDLFFDNERNKRQYGNFLKKHLIQKWIVKSRKQYKSGLYTCDREGSGLCAYWDRRSKMNNISCCHIELRFRRNWLKRFQIEMASFDKAWKKYFQFKWIDYHAIASRLFSEKDDVELIQRRCQNVIDLKMRLGRMRWINRFIKRIEIN